MKSISYKLSSTKDLLTSRAGLLCIGELMGQLRFSELVNTHFPNPLSNRGFAPSVFVNSLMLMLHEGGNCLDDLRHIREDSALHKLLGITKTPESDSLGDWLRRTGQAGVKAVTNINRPLLKKGLHHCRAVTLDIDAMISTANKKAAKWTYQKCKGYMPMVGYIAETGQVVATDFREGNIAPASNNLEFIEQCQEALPEGVIIKALRIDAAGYQVAIIDRCIDNNILFAIRAKMSKSLKQLITQTPEESWQPLLNRDGKTIEGECTTRVVHAMEASKHAFSVVVQRKLLKGQQTLDLETAPSEELLEHNGYLYRAIANNQERMNNNEIIHWYNQRGEHCENRIKELKIDFSAERMPCNDFAANALYFALCALAYNLFALLRSLLPKEWESCRAKTIRWRLYALAGKVVSHGRKVTLKLQAVHHTLLDKVLCLIMQVAQAS